MKCEHHRFFLNQQKFAIRHCGRGPHAERLSSQAAFSEKLSPTQYSESCFLTSLGYDRKSYLAILYIEDGVRRIPLREDRLPLAKGHLRPASPDGGEEFLRIEGAYLLHRLHGFSWR